MDDTSWSFSTWRSIFFCIFLGIKLYKKNDIKEKKDIIKKYIKRLLILFTFWILVGFVIGIRIGNPIRISELKFSSFSKISIKVFRRLLFNPWGALWYVLALIVAVLLIIPFLKRDKIEYAVIIGAILYIFALLCNNYYFLVENTIFEQIIDKYLEIFITERNGLFVGLYFVSIGMYISNIITNKNVRINYKVHTLILVISYLLFLLEILLIKNNIRKEEHSLFIMLTIVAPELFILTARLKGNYNTKLLRNYSTGIYFTHMPIINVITIISNRMKTTLNNYILFIIVLLIAMILLTICYKIDNKYLNKFIK